MKPRLPEKLGHLIGGEWLSRGSEMMTVVAPATGEVITQLPVASADTVDQAVQAAHAGLKASGFAAWSLEKRGALVRRLAELIEANLRELAELETWNTGKPIQETLNGDIPRSAKNCRFFSEFARHTPNSTYIDENGAEHTTVREPIGVVGLITPWNLPLYLTTWKLAPALMAGNAIVLKPAELTPLTAIALGHLVQQAGFPPGIVNIVHGLGAGSTGEFLVKHPRIKALSFTGETATGRAIMATAAPFLKKLSFELGGKGATLVCADADLDAAAEQAARAAFRNQGQICLAGSRLLVQDSVAEQLVAKIAQRVQAIKVGDPFDPATTMGSLISTDHRNRVAGFVTERPKNSKLICGGQIPKEFAHGAYYQPTIVLDVEQASTLVQQEIFGPVLTVQRFREPDQALAMLNDTPYGLSCSLWTKDIDRAQYLARRVQTGMVWINCWFARDLHTAFGGFKSSGIGREGGIHSLDFFSELKTITKTYSDRI